MDLDEWDLLSDDLHEDGRENTLFSSNSSTTTTTVIDMNYFQNFSRPHKRLSSTVIPLPIQFDFGDEKTDDQEVIKSPIETGKLDDQDQPIKDDDHQETVSQVFFKKLKENEFVDMKMDSLNRGIMPQIDVGTYQFERKSGSLQDEEEKSKKDDKEMLSDDDDGDGDDDDDDEGLNVWKWAMTGIGAVFSFGFAAVTVSLLVLGNRHNKASKKQDLHFQFYPHDKRLKQVMRRATRFNEAITVMRGAPVTRAHITIGGYYEGL